MADSNGSVLIGVDGGGSGCRAAVACDFQSSRGEGAGGSANFSTDPDGTIENVRAAISSACAQAGIDPAVLKTRGVAHVGLAGVMDDGDAARVAARLPIADCFVTDDRPTAVAGALGGGDGYVIAAGTGSFVARSVGGKAGFVGGWGLRIGDEASAAWIGRALISRVLHCADGLYPHSELTERILSEFESTTIGVVRFSLKATPFDYGAHAPKVVEAAKAGDANGLDLMRAGAAYLVQALKALGFAPGARLCAMGGIGGAFVDYLPGEMTANMVTAQGSPLDGAMVLAAQRAGKAGVA